MLILNRLNGFGAARAEQATAIAFPSVGATNTGSLTTLGNEFYDVPLPPGIQAGNLLIIAVTLRVSSARTTSTPSGWSPLYTTAGSTDLRRHSAYYRVADGTEGGTVRVSASGDARWGTVSYRVSSFSGTPEASSASLGSSSTPNSPSLSPSWGSAKTLWLAIIGQMPTSEGGSVSSYPSGYTGGIFGASGGSIALTASAHRQLEASSEDPGAFSMPSSANWVAYTVAVRGG